MPDNTTENSNAEKFWFEGVITPLIGIPGVLGNLLAIAVLLSKKLVVVKSIRHLLVQLAVYDTIVLISHMAFICPGNWFAYYRENYE